MHLVGHGRRSPCSTGSIRATILFVVVALFFGLDAAGRELRAPRSSLLAIASVSFIGIGMMTAVLPLISPEKGAQLGFVAQGMLLVVSGVYYPVERAAGVDAVALDDLAGDLRAATGSGHAILDGAGLSTMWDDDLAAAPDRRGLGSDRALGLPPRRDLREAAREAEAIGVKPKRPASAADIRLLRASRPLQTS